MKKAKSWLINNDADLDKKIKEELGSEHYGLAVMFMYDHISHLAFMAITQAYLYLGRGDKFIQYNLDKSLLTPIPSLNVLGKKNPLVDLSDLGLISIEERSVVEKIKDWRDKMVAHNTLHFDSGVRSGQIDKSEILELLKGGREIVDLLWKRLCCVSDIFQGLDHQQKSQMYLNESSEEYKNRFSQLKSELAITF